MIIRRRMKSGSSRPPACGPASTGRRPGRCAHRLDEGRDDVVMLLAPLVVEQRLLLQRLLDGGKGDSELPLALQQGCGHFQGVQRDAGRRPRTAWPGTPALRPLQSGRGGPVRAPCRPGPCFSMPRTTGRFKLLQGQYAAAREQGAMTSKEGFSVVCADNGDETLFPRRGGRRPAGIC